MSYKQVKWLILLIPTITVGLWEYVRHMPVMLRHLSMEAGNWLTPVIVLVVTLLLVRRLFSYLEQMQQQLQQERAAKVMLEERENIARQLHDGIAQSIFLLSVKMNQLEKQNKQIEEQEDYLKLKKTLQHMHEDVRQAIFNLRHPDDVHTLPWTNSLQKLVDDFKQETDIDVTYDWKLSEHRLSAKEKVELYACLREIFMNVRKHAHASRLWIYAGETEDGWMCKVADDGIGPGEGPEEQSDRRHAVGSSTDSAVSKVKKNGFGIDIMRDRAHEMGWCLRMYREQGRTVVHIRSQPPEERKKRTGEE
jgi:two-component system, NarL family, nitrate/nitrite sensor histidine kinase NarQ